MSDWPKKMWMNQLGQVSEHGNRKYEIAVLVYPVDQAPEPVAWRYLGKGTGRVDFSDMQLPRHLWIDGFTEQPLYLPLPSESAIRASERKRCANALLATIDPDTPLDFARLIEQCAQTLRELGDE